MNERKKESIHISFFILLPPSCAFFGLSSAGPSIVFCEQGALVSNNACMPNQTTPKGCLLPSLLYRKGLIAPVAYASERKRLFAALPIGQHADKRDKRNGHRVHFAPT